jgi:hypothetical protein
MCLMPIGCPRSPTRVRAVRSGTEEAGTGGATSLLNSQGKNDCEIDSDLTMLMLTFRLSPMSLSNNTRALILLPSMIKIGRHPSYKTFAY